MTWWEYVRWVAPDASQAEVAQAASVEQSSVSRWKLGKGAIRPENAAAFAHAYGRPVLEAYVAAGFLTQEEANAEITVAVPNASRLSDESLAREVYRRLAHAEIQDGAVVTDSVVSRITRPGRRNRSSVARGDDTGTVGNNPAQEDRTRATNAKGDSSSESSRSTQTAYQDSHQSVAYRGQVTEADIAAARDAPDLLRRPRQHRSDANEPPPDEDRPE